MYMDSYKRLIDVHPRDPELERVAHGRTSADLMKRFTRLTNPTFANCWRKTRSTPTGVPNISSGCW